MRAKHAVAFGLAGVLALASLIGGAERSAASETELCSAGHPLCVKVTDTDYVSKSTGDKSRYGKFAVTIRNGGNNEVLTQLTVTVRVADVLANGATAPTTAAYVPSQSTLQCTAVASDTLSCVVPQTLGPGESYTYDPLVWRTSTGADVVALQEQADVSVKEQLVDRPRTDPRSDRVIVNESLSYELNIDRSASYAFAGASIVLDTAPDGVQWSTFPLNVPAGAASFVGTLAESPTAGSFCPDCFGQIVSALGGGIFSAANPFEVLMTTSLALAPSGTNANTLTVVHRRLDGSVATTKRQCSGAFGTTPAASELPCRRVAIDRSAGLIRTDFFDFFNGDVGIF